MHKRVLMAFAILCLMGFTPILCAAGEGEIKEIRAVGVADGKSSKARDEAINDALRRAVEQGVGTFVVSELTVDQQRLVDEKIYTASQGYIQRYEIIKESPGKALYEVEISALVKMGKLGNDLEAMGLLLRKKANPRVMVIVYSQEQSSEYWDVSLEGNRHVENQVESGLLEKGFQLVDAAQVNQRRELESMLAQGDPSRANRLAKDFGAEILIDGEVRRSFVDRRTIFGRPTRFFSNEVRLKALETDTGRLLFSGFRAPPPSGAGALQPLETATDELLDEMVEGIMKQWRKDVFQASTYQLNISNISFGQLTKLKEEMKGIRGIQRVQLRNYQSGHALLEVLYQGPLQELAEKVHKTGSAAMEITGLQANTIDITYQK